MMRMTSLVVALLAVTCGEAADTARESGTTVQPSAATAKGSGTLTLGATKYEFEIVYCDFAPTQGSDGPTLSGRGQTADGRTFNVLVNRDDVLVNDDARGEEIVVIIGEERFEASVMNLGNGWHSFRGPVDGPLVQIEGTELTASGEFADRLEEVIEDGMLEASCESA
jgi:hypothetical protein